MKLALVTETSNILEYMKIGADAFIFGLKNFSSGYQNELTIGEIREIKEKYNIELFIAINKNIFNNELVELEEKIVELDKIGVNGILFYDLAVLSIKKRLNLAVDLVWNQTHMVTNYNTCNYYYDKGCKYGVIASEITLEEINEISRKTDMKLFVNILGYQAMGYSRRSLLSNYYKSINKNMKNNNQVVKNNGEEYIISEEENGNAFYYGRPLNGSDAVLDLNVDYIIMSDFLIDDNIFEKCVKLYRKLIDTKDIKLIQEIDDLIGDNRGFFFKKSIYKVKKDG